MQKHCERLKTTAVAKTAPMKAVGFSTWKEAEATIPEFSKPEVLENFQIRKGKPLPKGFTVSVCIQSRLLTRLFLFEKSLASVRNGLRVLRPTIIIISMYIRFILLMKYS